jgi:prephenate dehydrogenase
VESVPDRRAGILGTGLIGASIGLSLGRLGWKVTGWDKDPYALSIAASRGAVSSMAASEEDLTSRALDLLVVATPPKVTPHVLRGLSTDALVTDVTGIKAEVVAAGAHLVRFVSSHPMAGREVSGPEAADASLFNGAAWIIVTDGATETDIATLERVVQLLGAHPERMDAARHDRVVTAISHLPQILASTLITEAAGTVPGLSLIGGSFRDLTRVAASDPTLWSELLDTNRTLVIEMLGTFGRRLTEMSRLLAARRTDDLVDSLSEAARLHRELHAPVGLVEVALPDRPGELAAVGRALDHARVDVRDLQLRHAPYGGGGLLRVFVHNADLPTLSAALAAEGLTVTREEKR